MSAFDLDGVAGDVEPFVFTLKGVKFELPTLAQLPFAEVVTYREADEEQALRLLLGDRMDEFLALGPTMAQVKALADAWWRYQGTTPPESPASTPS